MANVSRRMLINATGALGVSIVIKEGGLRCLLGANGADKTTLMDLMSGKTESTDGRIFRRQGRFGKMR
jgi:ABC-type uncharacterized transport system ATPase subunit